MLPIIRTSILVLIQTLQRLTRCGQLLLEDGFIGSQYMELIKQWFNDTYQQNINPMQYGNVKWHHVEKLVIDRCMTFEIFKGTILILF